MQRNLKVLLKLVKVYKEIDNLLKNVKTEKSKFKAFLLTCEKPEVNQKH